MLAACRGNTGRGHVGLFQEQWQTHRIISRTPARVFTICGTEPPFSLSCQRRHFHELCQPTSFEEALGADPKYHCCTFRGSVVALDAATGKQIWQAFTIQEAAKAAGTSQAGIQEYGPSGTGVWSSPTIDEQLGVVYVATGNNYSEPPTNTSDAILAIHLKTGKLVWSKQLSSDDVYNNGCATPQQANCQHPAGPDYDFGQPPILARLRGAKRALVIAQKSGMVYAVDPDQKGKVIWQTRAGEGGSFGGSQWGSASDGNNV